MKSRLLIILLIVGLNVFAQVPNTTTFTLQDVVDEVNPTTNDLQDCFNDADESKFDLNYYSSGNDLLEFRNYNSSDIDFVSAWGTTNLSGGSTITVDAFTSAQVGDLLLLVIAYQPSTSITNIGTLAWNAITTNNAYLSTPNLGVYTREVTSQDLLLSYYTVYFDSSTPYLASMYLIRGQASIPISSNWQGFVSLSATTSASLSIIQDVSNSTYITMIATRNVGNNPTLSSGSDYWRPLPGLTGSSTLGGGVFTRTYGEDTPSIDFDFSTSCWYYGVMLEIID
jgi:hypothetical protein